MPYTLDSIGFKGSKGFRVYTPGLLGSSSETCGASRALKGCAKVWSFGLIPLKDSYLRV